MKNRKYYEAMSVSEISCIAEKKILTGSIVDNSLVRSVGQEVKNLDFTDPSFNLEWETDWE